MSALRVIQPGMFSAVQDLGRPGHSHLGVPSGGAADTLSLRAGNRLVGSPDSAAAIEMTLTGGEFQFDSDTIVALAALAAPNAVLRTGSGGETALPLWTPRSIRAGDTVSVGPITHGARAYLCVRSGIEVPLVLGSRSTLVAAQLGGHAGRALRAGDLLPISPSPGSGLEASSPDSAALPFVILNFIRAALMRRPLRLIPGAQHADFDPAGVATLAATTFVATDRADRMGICLNGPPIPAPFGGRMTTEAMPHGSIQVPADGRPILLMPDRPVTGGYPVIGCVAAVDLFACGQLRPRDRVSFEFVTEETARRLCDDFESTLDRLLPPTS